MEFAKRMDRFGEGIFSKLAEIKKQKLKQGDEGYVVKFKAVELLEQFKGWLEGR